MLPKYQKWDSFHSYLKKIRTKIVCFEAPFAGLSVKLVKIVTNTTCNCQQNRPKQKNVLSNKNEISRNQKNCL